MTRTAATAARAFRRVQTTVPLRRMVIDPMCSISPLLESAGSPLGGSSGGVGFKRASLVPSSPLRGPGGGKSNKGEAPGTPYISSCIDAHDSQGTSASPKLLMRRLLPPEDMESDDLGFTRDSYS